MDPITAFIVQALIGAAISGAVTLAQQAFAPKPTTTKAALPSFRGQYSTGGTVPLKFVLGTYGVAGQLEYSNTWGNSGETPNANLVDVISLSDYRLAGVPAVWVNSRSATLSGTGSLLRGYPLAPEFEVGGKDYAWYRFLTGAQTTANAYLLDVFGGDSKRPWESDMVGKDIAYAIMTARVNEKLWSGFPAYMFQVQGAPVFDPRLSTAAGGSGSQVWGTFSTYAFSDNPVVLIYNILRGIAAPDGDHLWGGRATAYQLPYAEWAAAMDRCDDLIAKKGGGTEKRYRAGIEIAVNERPADVIRELLIACNGRIAFERGRYHILVDVPEEADGSFTDGDLLLDQPIEFSQFPNVDNVINGASATFLAPQRAWEERETKPYFRADLEEEDFGQRITEKLQLRCVFSSSQAQRILKAVVQESRRFKRHVVALPPTFANYRPLQVLAWTSAEFQYSAKLFLIISRTEDEWGNVLVALQELDPSDFDWDAETDETELTYADITPVVVPSQAVAGWAVEPWDDGGRRPGLHLEWEGALDDVRSVQVQIRHDGATLAFFDREYPYAPNDATQDIYISGDPLVRNTIYEVRAKFIPFDGSGRETDWSDWLSETTPDIGVRPEDLGATLASMNTHFGVSIRDINEQLMLSTSLGAGQDLANYSDRLFVIDQMTAGDATTYAASVNALLLAVGNDATTLADALAAIEAASGDVRAGFLTRMTAVASPGGGWVRYGQQIKVEAGEAFVTVSDFWEVNSSSGLSRRVMKASETYFVDDADNILAMFAAGGASFNQAYIKNLTATNIATKSLNADHVLINGTLITTLLATNAATVGAIGIADSDVTTDTSSDYHDLVDEDITVPSSASGVMILFMCNVRRDGSDVFPQFRIRRGSTTLVTFYGGFVFNNFGETAKRMGTTMIHLDSPGSGTFTYTVQARANAGGSSYEAAKFATNRIALIALKR